jgi:tRNA (guanine37-N1)-methyltransferase
MRIDILTVVPKLLESPFADSIIQRAQDNGVVEICVHDIRNWSKDKHKKVDDEPFGGIAGMVMTIQPILDAINELRQQRTYSEIIYLTPDGEQLKQARVNQLSIGGNIIMICGHYKGIDERLRQHIVTLEISIGDYVLSGGELAAAVLTDAIVRILPGAIGDEQSALTDSFQDDLLAPPIYTRPANYNGWEVPEILRSGDHAAIEKWMEQQAYERTKSRRPDLLDKDS